MSTKLYKKGVRYVETLKKKEKRRSLCGLWCHYCSKEERKKLLRTWLENLDNYWLVVLGVDTLVDFGVFAAADLLDYLIIVLRLELHFKIVVVGIVGHTLRHLRAHIRIILGSGHLFFSLFHFIFLYQRVGFVGWFLWVGVWMDRFPVILYICVLILLWSLLLLAAINEYIYLPLVLWASLSSRVIMGRKGYEGLPESTFIQNFIDYNLS